MRWVNVTRVRSLYNNNVRYGSHGPLVLQPSRLNYIHVIHWYLHTRHIHSSFSCPRGQCTCATLQSALLMKLTMHELNLWHNWWKGLCMEVMTWKDEWCVHWWVQPLWRWWIYHGLWRNFGIISHRCCHCASLPTWHSLQRQNSHLACTTFRQCPSWCDSFTSMQC